MAVLAKQGITEKVNATTGAVTAGIVEIWPDGEKYKDWDLDKFGDAVLDIKSSDDPLYGPVCAMESALKNKATWRGVRLILGKIHKMYKSSNKEEQD